VESKIKGVSIRQLQMFSDERGSLMELFRNDELETIHQPAMAYFSETLPGVARGPHEHIDQTDYFAFVGPGNFNLYLWKVQKNIDGKIVDVIQKEKFKVGESNPAAVIVPPGVIHAYKNISKKPGMVFNAPNQLYAGPGKKYPVDEIRHEDADNEMLKLH
jgi:dTDP-4-dehydrorhamnose 3,5-epimerase